MNMSVHGPLTLLLIVFQFTLVHNFFIFDPFISLYNKFYLKCDDTFFKKDLVGLSNDFKYRLFGQPFATGIVEHALRGHLRKINPSKPLALSFHGWTGSGKNHVANLIVNRLYLEGFKSPYVHEFMAKYHFPLKSNVHKYQIELRDKIVSSVRQCKHSLFIFDEVHLYPAGVLDVVKPFLDYKYEIDGVDYRHAIFIFLSNIGGNVITKTTLDLWKDGVKREDFRLRDFEKFLTAESFNDGGGFYKSDIIDSHLIDHYVPFLPLEEDHVISCIKTEFEMHDIEPNAILFKEILDDMTFTPEPEKLFSVVGCKRISQLVSVLARKIRSRHYEL